MDTPYFGTRSRYDNSIFEEHNLRNGISVYCQRPQLLTDDEGILIAFLPLIGSCVERQNEQGIVHFMEHVFMDSLNGKSLARELWNMAGQFSAYVTKTEMVLGITAPKSGFNRCAEALSRLLREPEIDTKSVKLTSDVIIREYERYFSSGGFHLSRAWDCELFGQGHPIGHPVIGKPEIIRDITAERLRDFYLRFCHTGNIRLICGGAFSELDIEKVQETLDDCFRDIRCGKPVNINITGPIRKPGENITIFDPNFARDSVIVSWFDDGGIEDHDDDAQWFLADSLAGDMFSPLIESLRVGRGLTYEVGLCEVIQNSHYWTFSLVVHTPRSHFDEVTETFYKVLKELDPKRLYERQCRRQMVRQCKYSDAVKTCRRLPDVFTIDEKLKTHHYWESIADELTVERVFRWRNYLLSHEPVTVKAITG